MLGYGNYAEVSLATKMAQSPAQVIESIRELVARAKPFAEKDMSELTEFARKTLNMADVEAWDVSYLSEKLRAARYDFSDNEVKQYFPEAVVLSGMFRLVETLYGVAIKESEAATWHPAVRFFDVVDNQGALIGQFYLDLYARKGSAAGRGWTTPSTVAGWKAGCSIRWRFSPAISPRRWAASLRCSHTMK